MGVALATSAYGISFGALAVASGLDVWQTCVLSLLMFTGGSQFAFAGVIGAGGIAAAPAAIASASLLGVRNIAYGIRMSPVIGARSLASRGRRAVHDRRVDGGLARPAITARPARRILGDGHRHLHRLEPVDLAGALLGDVLGDPRAYGLDAAAAAAFLALLWPRLRHRQPIAVGDRRRGRRDAAHPGADAGLPVIVAAFVAIIVGWTNWLGAARGRAAEPDDVAEREGLP